MVICNIVVDEIQSLNEKDIEILEIYKKCGYVNVINTLELVDETVPTIFYGYKTALENYGEFDRKNLKMDDQHWWSYTHSEISIANWVVKFVNQCERNWFFYINSGIDIIFDNFDINSFVSKLSTYPLIHEGDYEIYIADLVDEKIVVYSIKKDTLKYAGIDPSDFLSDIELKLNYNFLSIDSKRYDLVNKPTPVFLDDLIFSNSGEIIEVKDISTLFSNKLSCITIDRPKAIVYYLKRTMHLRNDFILYQKQSLHTL